MAPVIPEKMRRPGDSYKIGFYPKSERAMTTADTKIHKTYMCLICGFIYDEAAGQNRRYADGWQAAASVVEPSGGLTVDAEARNAVAGLVAALVAGGILPGS